MSEVGKLKGLVVGQYGDAIVLTLVDKDGAAVDISAYTTSLAVTLRDPYTLKTVSYSASFVTSGSDGRIQFTPVAGDIDRAGTWEGQVKLEKASAVAISKVFDVFIDKRISVST